MIDVVLTVIGLLLLAPVFAVLAWKVRREFGAPVLFRQPRPGLDGRLFTIHKFRTMTDERGPDGELLPDHVRLTAFGRWLRSSSLDELPEMFNVLAGEMSLVGPRPLLVEYLDLYTPTQARRHEVRPGITGWAQTHGRNDMSWEDKLALDVWYVDHRGPWLDLRILLKTLYVMVRREGISMAGHATAERFRGTAQGTEPPQPTDPSRSEPARRTPTDGRDGRGPSGDRTRTRGRARDGGS